MNGRGSGSPDQASALDACSHLRTLILPLDPQQLFEVAWPALCIELLGGVIRTRRELGVPVRHHESESARDSEEKS